MRGSDQLRRDTRGAVMVIGVFMSAFLVGVLWYVIGIGDAVVYREAMQDGADASAFAAAVYQARGMNLIALINLIMAAVLAVLVALKIAQLLLIAANVASCVAALFVWPLAAVCEATTQAEEPLQSFISKTEQIVDKVLKGLYLAESGIAVGMPYVAEAKAIIVARQYKPTVHGGLMLSISLIPGHVTQFLGNIGSSGGQRQEPEEEPTPSSESKVICADGWVSSCECDRPHKRGCCKGHLRVSGRCTKPPTPHRPRPDPGDTAQDTSSSDGIRWGLPVEDDSYSFLCKKAGEFVVELVFLPFSALDATDMLKPFVDPIKGLVKGIVGMLVETFPGYFCGDGGIDMSGLENRLRDFGSKECNNRTADREREAGDGPVELVDPAKCQEQIDKAIDRMSLPKGTPVGKKVPKKVYSPARNGDNYFASWAIVWGNLGEQSGANKGVDIAAWGKRRVKDPSLLSRFHFAKSEYYFEPAEDMSPTWDDIKEDAMWHMRWRARLRRSHLPPMNLGSMLAQNFRTSVGGALGDTLGEDNPAVDPILDMIASPVDRYGEALDSYIGEKVGNVNEGIIH